MRKLRGLISKILIVAFLITNVLAYFPGVSFAAGKTKDNTTVVRQNADKTEILIKYKDSGKADKVKSDVKTKGKFKKLETKKIYEKSKIDLLEIDKSDDINEVIDELKADPNVEYAQPNYKLDVMAVPTDPMFSNQWGLQNNGQETEAQVGRSGVDINAVNAWNITQGASSVVIGVLDTGIDLNHNDLKNNIYVNTAEVANNGVDDDHNGYIDDVSGWDFVHNDKTIYDDATLDLHGTHVAGIVAASTNSEGIAGVAPKVKILPLKFINGNWGYTCDAIDAIEYAMKKGVKVINCSFGGTDNNFALKDTMVNSGILFICAAGNRGADVSVSPVYPACFYIPNVLSVASIDSKGVLSPYSSYGNKIHVAAPGVNILSTTPNNTYDYFTGTSAAVPFVTGVAALLKSYLPSLTIAQISQRIKDNVVPCTNLSGKVSSGGRVDAYAALTNTKPATDTYTGPGNDNSTVPAGQQGGNVDTWYTMDQLAKIKEKLHYGESGVSPASGNFSFTVNDMSVPAPGFQINISRTYNSRSDKSTPFGRGWTFGFEGMIEGTNVMDVTLPNGSVERFRLNNNVYEPEESRSTLVKNADGTYTLTTKDQYKYTFNTNRYLVKMEDRNGNAVNITVDAAGKITKITDTVNREYIVNYNASNGLIDNITDAENRMVKYEYDSNNRLAVVTDPMGGKMRYFYDTWGYLKEIQDHNYKVVEKVTYNHAEGENQHKVSEATDSLGDTVSYTYDTTNRKTTAKDINGRVSTYWFDTSFFTIQVQEPDGRSTYTEYYQYGGKNKYGDIKSTTDRNGNKTQYEVDAKGNVTKITNPDNSFAVKEYDEKNNLTKEIDECGNTTYYVYDANKVNLLKKVQPLNGTDIYTGVDSANFAVTAYAYYIGSESGCAAKSLLKSETDPEGNITTYTYDTYGNTKTVSDPETNKLTQYEYNRIGWRTAEITPKLYRTEYAYDKNGQLIKTTTVSAKNETQRTVYDLLGRKVQEISPKQYDSTKDNLVTDTYSDNTVGTRYEYFDSGKLKSQTDALGYKTSYTYDIYGNILTETKPNNSIYRYEYDVLDRLKKVYFKNDNVSSETLLFEYNYAVLDDGNTQTTEIKYLNSTNKAITVSIYDYTENLVEQQNPDGTKIKTIYNLNGTVEKQIGVNGSTTYLKYDGLRRLVEQWMPFEISNGNIRYTYVKTEYDKADNKTVEKTGKDKVELWSIPTNFVINSYAYYKNGNLKNKTDNEGRKTEYLYDDDGNMTKESVYTDSVNKLVTEYTYNYLEKMETKVQHVNEGDIYGYSYNSVTDKTLTTTYTYDKNGNTETVKTPDNITTTYVYDALDRVLSTSKPGLDETGNAVTITELSTYNWQGNPLTKTDAKGKNTIYEYNQSGFLVKTINAKSGVTLYDYDLSGRKIAEVSPKNYDNTKSINEMNRIEYVYDLMDRLLAKKDIYFNTVQNQWLTLYSKTYKYDNSGNRVKELDAIGYDNGTGSTLEERIDNGYGTEYRYNLTNLVETITDPVSKERELSYTTKYEYDALGRKLSETNANGVETVYTYNDAGNLLIVGVKKDSAATAQTMKSSTYDLAGRFLTQTDGNGNLTTYEYNALGKLRKAIYPGDSTIASNTVIYQYDSMSNLALQQDSLGKVDLFTYDNEGRELSHTQKKSDNTQVITTYTKYDKNGNKCVETNGKGVTTTSTYDELNRLETTKITVSGVLHTTTYGYDANSNQTTVTDWLGNTSTNIYDALNRLIEKRDPYTTIQKLEYNKNSKQIKSIDALGNVTQYIYDKNNRLIATIDPELHTTSQSYDDVGNISSKTDGRSISTSYKYDEFNRLIMVIDPKSNTTTYTYDLNGNMLTQTDGNTNTTTYEYNVANKATKKIDQGGRLGTPGNYTYLNAKTEKYTYYADGNIKNVTDRNGKITTNTYDIHGRLLSKAIDSTTISYTYDNNGNQLTMTDSTGTTTRTYDELNRVLTKAVPGFGTTIFTYDTSEGLGLYSETTTDFKGNVTKKIFDKVGRLYKVVADSKTTTYEYYDNGSRKSVTYSTGAKEEYTYYKDGLNKTLVNKKANGTILDSYSYTYDSAHNQKTKTDSKGLTEYTYDSLNRLETVTEPTGRITSYTFDKAGNRLTENVTTGATSVITTYNYNEQNRLTSTVKQSGSTTVTDKYLYDNNGNTVSKTTETVKPVESAVSGSFTVNKSGQSVTTQATNYRYDVWNKLTKTVTGEKTVTYSYNAEGYRVGKVENGQTTKYLYEGDKVILETDGAGNQTAKNIYGSNLLTRTAGSDKMDYMYNGHGDVTSLISTDANGVTNKLFSYDYSQNLIWTYHGFDITVDTASNYTFSFDAYISADANIPSTGTTFIANEEQGTSHGFYYDNTKKGTWQHFEYIGKPNSSVVRALLYPTTSSKPATKGIVQYKNVKFRKEGTTTNLFTQPDSNSGFTIKGSGDFTVSDAVVSYYYDAFGNITEQNGDAANNITYAGYQYDSETDLYYLNARYYDSKIARFINEDTYAGNPNDPLSLNLYTYCANNPIMYTDPTGNIYITDGSEGTDVSAIQAILGVKVTGKYDAATKQAVNDYKKKNNLGNSGSNYGVVGDQTYASIISGRVVSVSEVNQMRKSSGSESGSSTNYGMYSATIARNVGIAENLKVTTVASVIKTAKPSNDIIAGNTGNPNSTLFSNVQVINTLATRYTNDTTLANQLVLQFIRRNSYSGGNWNAVAGKIDEAFIEYINKYNPGMAVYFTGDIYLSDKSGEKVDFNHMAATLNALLYDTGWDDAGAKSIIGDTHIDNLAGWAGDLQTFAIFINKKLNNSDDYNKIYNTASEWMGKAGTTFDMTDLLADVDAVNINNRLDSSSSLASVMKNYYQSGYKTRYSSFVKSISGNDVYPKDFQGWVDDYTNDYWYAIKWPLFKNANASMTDNQSKAISDAFTNFIWKKVYNEK